MMTETNFNSLGENERSKTKFRLGYNGKYERQCCYQYLFGQKNSLFCISYCLPPNYNDKDFLCCPSSTHLNDNFYRCAITPYSCVCEPKVTGFYLFPFIPVAWLTDFVSCVPRCLCHYLQCKDCDSLYINMCEKMTKDTEKNRQSEQEIQPITRQPLPIQERKCKPRESFPSQEKYYDNNAKLLEDKTVLVK